MRSSLHIILLAIADFKHERMLSICSIFGLAAVLAPLLILYGVKFGVVQTLTSRMASDPNTLEITPVASGRFTEQHFASLRTVQGVAFILPRTRSIAATMNLSAVHEGVSRQVTVSLEPTATGDPLLGRYQAPTVTMVPWQEQDHGAQANEATVQTQSRPSSSLLAKRPEADDPNLREAGVVLSDGAARKLAANKGDSLLGTVERAYGGRISRAYVRLRVHGILPLAAQQKDTAYVPLELVEGCEDFRDGRAVPELGAANGWTGEERPGAARIYPSFRLYADSLQSVTTLRDYLARNGVETYTHAEEIEQITTLENGLNLIFSLICLVACVGFFSSTTSSVLAAIKRKQRTLGLLQLTGFGKGQLMLFPLAQVVLTALLGTTLAVVTYVVTALWLNTSFAGSLQGLEQVCLLLPVHYGMAYLMSIVISLLAAIYPAWRSTKIEPSEVIRDV
ncbi:MAG TPA: ABC transporter permease [Candidatus Desulfovibrio intestinipullorum]|uniref:ABC transporter permease n=1 Tax=Candidatus Desulfovibrio intestinipullorum TaxID=2838536 RepID=A0A9D1TR86_9BACT|nr:ABC transporter permease [Candidatus Desulfovibrio intestinipullorum]